MSAVPTGAAAGASKAGPADVLLSARDADGVAVEPPSPLDLELVEQVRSERARARTFRRRLLLAGVALVIFAVAIVSTQRAVRGPAPGPQVAREAAPPPSRVKEELDPPVPTASPRASSPAPNPPVPAARQVDELRPRELPARPPREVRTPAPRPESIRREPAAMPSAIAPRVEQAPRPRRDLRVEVTHKQTGGAVDYVVRVLRPDGAPVSGADVRLRGVMADGDLVEARLDPGAEPGVYRSLLAFSSRGPRDLTVRVDSPDGLVEIPAGDPFSDASTRPR